jgi:hypothetical protein
MPRTSVVNAVQNRLRRLLVVAAAQPYTYKWETFLTGERSRESRIALLGPAAERVETRPDRDPERMSDDLGGHTLERAIT